MALTMSLIILILILTLINMLAFWQRHIFLYMLAGPADIVFGLYYAWQTDPFKNASVIWSPTFVVGVIVVIIGAFCLVRSFMKIIDRVRR